MRKMVEKGLHVRARRTSRSAAPTAPTSAIHNYDNRSDRYVIPHEELFLGHFGFTPRLQAQRASR